MAVCRQTLLLLDEYGCLALCASRLSAIVPFCVALPGRVFHLAEPHGTNTATYPFLYQPQSSYLILKSPGSKCFVCRSYLQGAPCLIPGRALNRHPPRMGPASQVCPVLARACPWQSPTESAGRSGCLSNPGPGATSGSEIFGHLACVGSGVYR